MNIYKDKCTICKSPSIKSICSNNKCKSWHKYRSLPTHKITQGMTSNDPFILYCPTCFSVGESSDSATKLYCRRCVKSYPYLYIKNMWYRMETTYNIYTTQYIERPSLWDYENEIGIYKGYMDLNNE